MKLTLSEKIHKEDQISNRKASKIPWVLLGKVVGTVTIFTFLLSRVDLSLWGYAVKESLGYWLIGAFFVNSLAFVTSTFKWDCLLRALRIMMPKRVLLELYTIGFFMSSFLPGVVGGDIVRCHMAGQWNGGRLRVAATIVAERVAGVAALVVMSVLALAWDSRLVTLSTLILLGAMSSALAGGLALILNRYLATGLMYRTRRLRMCWIVRPMYQLHRTLRSFPRKPLLVAVGYSFVFYLGSGLTFFLICKAFGANITFLEATSVQVLTCLFILIPISVGGLGLAQAGDIYLLGILGVDAAHALGISVVRWVINCAYILIGGLLFIRWHGHPGVVRAMNPSHSQAQPGDLLGGTKTPLKPRGK